MTSEKMDFVRQQPLICAGHSRPVVDLNFSKVTDDGFFLASGCLDGNPMLRDGSTGDWIGTFQGHKGAVWSCVLNEPATKAATASADFTVKIWDAISGDELHSLEHKHVVRSVRFSNDGTRLLTGGNRKIVRLFDMGDLSAEPEEIGRHEDHIKIAMFLPDPNLLVSGGKDGFLRVWDLRKAEGEKEVKTLKVDGPVMSIELSWDKKFLTVAAGKEVSFWDVNTLEQIKSYKLNITVDSASLHPDADRFLAGGDDNWVHVFGYDDGKEREAHKGHHGPVHAVRYAPTGTSYASGSDDGTIRIWQTNPLAESAPGEVVQVDKQQQP